MNYRLRDIAELDGAALLDVDTRQRHVRYEYKTRTER
jgi:hypothetical protein